MKSWQLTFLQTPDSSTFVRVMSHIYISTFTLHDYDLTLKSGVQRIAVQLQIKRLPNHRLQIEPGFINVSGTTFDRDSAVSIFVSVIQLAIFKVFKLWSSDRQKVSFKESHDVKYK